MNESLSKLRQDLLTGVSHMIPLIAAGGILIAAAIAMSPIKQGGGPDVGHTPYAQQILDIGVAAFRLAHVALAGYIAYSIAGKPGLAPGFVGGLLAWDGVTIDGQTVRAGFLGAILIGLIAGWAVYYLKLIPVPRWIKPIMPILVIPITSCLLVGGLMIGVLGPQLGMLLNHLTAMLREMGTGNSVLLAAVLGAMIAFDMGGPVNKAAFTFGATLITQGNYEVMGACAAAICTPPLGLGLATLIARRLWTEEEREAGKAALAMGMIGITEGAIPFAAGDPLRVLPSIIAGSVVAAVIAMVSKVGDMAPHGGPIVLPVVINPVMFIVAIVAGTVTTAMAIIVLKAISARPEILVEPVEVRRLPR